MLKITYRMLLNTNNNRRLKAKFQLKTFKNNKVQIVMKSKRKVDRLIINNKPNFNRLQAKVYKTMQMHQNSSQFFNHYNRKCSKVTYRYNNINNLYNNSNLFKCRCKCKIISTI